jgi:hypothetical protein
MIPLFSVVVSHNSQTSTNDGTHGYPGVLRCILVFCWCILQVHPAPPATPSLCCPPHLQVAHPEARFILHTRCHLISQGLGARAAAPLRAPGGPVAVPHTTRGGPRAVEAQQTCPVGRRVGRAYMYGMNSIRQVGGMCRRCRCHRVNIEGATNRRHMPVPSTEALL